MSMAEALYTRNTNASQILNENSFKHCKRKLYNTYICKAPSGWGFDGRNFCVPNQIEKLRAQGKKFYILEGEWFFVVDSIGRIKKITPQEAAQKYQFLNGGSPVAINMESLNKKTKDGVLDWTLVQSVADNRQYWAAFVPRTIQYQQLNKDPKVCGKGDFYVVADAGGKPNLTYGEVINGLAFAKEFNNQGWTDCIDQRAADAINITIDKLPKIPSASSANKETEKVSPEEVAEITKTLGLIFSAIFMAEGFKVTDQGSTEESTRNGKARLTVAEADNSKSTTIFLTLDSKANKLNIKCRRDGKDFDKTYNLSVDSQQKLNVIFLCAYLDFCSLFKMTPFRYITRPRWLAQCVNGAEGEYALKVNQKSFENDFAENSSASARFQLGIFKGNASQPVSVYNTEIRVNLNKAKIKELIDDVKKTGTIHPTLEKESFIIKLKVANAPVQQIGVNEVLNLRKLLLSGFLAERQRQGASNAVQQEKRSRIGGTDISAVSQMLESTGIRLLPMRRGEGTSYRVRYSEEYLNSIGCDLNKVNSLKINFRYDEAENAYLIFILNEQTGEKLREAATSDGELVKAIKNIPLR